MMSLLGAAAACRSVYFCVFELEEALCTPCSEGKNEVKLVTVSRCREWLRCEVIRTEDK